MSKLAIPEIVTIKLKVSEEQDYRVPNIVFGVDTCARHKNNYHLGPFFSDKNGIVIITREMLDISAEATMETGIMDYAPITDCYPQVTICLWSENQLEKAIKGRRLWGLLKRENILWESTEKLIEKFHQANNKNLIISEELSCITDEWNGNQQKYVYDFIVTPK